MILSKETSLFQHDKIKDGIDNASKEASNYLTDIDSGGVYVHAVNNNSDGVRITDRIDIVRGDSSVAEYGTSVRIGNEALGSSTIYIDPGSADAGITNVFRIIASNGVDAFNVLLDEDHISDSLTTTERFGSSKYNYGGISELTTTPKSLTEIKVISELSSVIAGDTFNIKFAGNLGGNFEWEYPSTAGFFELAFDFIKGTDESKTSSLTKVSRMFGITVNITFSVVYTSDDNSLEVTVTATATSPMGLTSDISEVYLSELSYTLPGVMIPIHKFNGDVYLDCESVGETYLGLNVDKSASSSTDAIDGDDKDLFNAIRKLGWYSDVIDE